MIVEETQKDGQWMGLDRWVAWEMVCQTYFRNGSSWACILSLVLEILLYPNILVQNFRPISGIC